jgi:renalase
MLEVAIVGAGVAGVTCGRELQAAGWQGVGIFEKSRGVGGRLTTRRMFDTCVDRGTCYVSPKGAELTALCDRLLAAGILTTWTQTTHCLSAAGDLIVDGDIYPRYVAPAGMNQIAKYLAQDLDISFNCRAIAVCAVAEGWQIVLEGIPTPVLARRLVIAIPAPQAVDLLSSTTSISPAVIDDLKSIEFAPSIAVAAGYTPTQLAQWQATYPQAVAVSCPEDPNVAWVGLDSSKRIPPAPPVFVVQSTAAFADRYPEPSDLSIASLALLKCASNRLLPWFEHPQWQQPHLWRYAFPKHPRSDSFLSIDTPHPLFCTGDWCRGYRLEDAFLAGKAVAAHLIDRSGQTLPTV